MRALSIAIAALALTAAPTTVAASVPRMRPFATGTGPVTTDGVRYAMYQPRPGAVRVMDTGRGTSVVLDVSHLCPPRAIGGGQVLFSCFDRDPRSKVILYDIARRAFDHPTGLEDIPPPNAVDGSLELIAIGSMWLEGISHQYHAATFFYVNQHSGHVRFGPSPASVDLDSSRLIPPRCSPISEHSPVGPDEVEGELNRQYLRAYQPPFGLTSNASFPVTARVYRCGHARPLVTCSCPDAQLGAAILSWHGYGPSNARLYAHVYDARSSRDLRWRIGLDLAPATVVHTRRWLFAYEFFRGRYRIRVARIP